MMNKKGFTIIEVIVSFSMISIILTSIVGFAINYRNRLKDEEVISQLVDFKNTITKVVYDDIFRYGIVRIEKCISSSSCANFIDRNNNIHTLEIIDIRETSSVNKKGAYLSYDGIKYMLPDSDIRQGDQYMCNFDGKFIFSNYNDRIYTLKIQFTHYGLNKEYEIFITTAN